MLLQKNIVKKYLGLLDMCRLGIGLYGVEPYRPHEPHAPYKPHDALVPVSTLKTTILQLRHVPKGDTVGYSRRFFRQVKWIRGSSLDPLGTSGMV